MGNIDLSAPTGVRPINEKGKSSTVRWHTITGADATTKKGSGLAENDVIYSVPVAEGELVQNVWLVINTASTASGATLTVGDDGDVDGYIKSVTCDSVAGTKFSADGSYLFTQATTTEKPVTWVGGRYYTAANTVDLKLGATTIDTGFSANVYIDVVDLA